MRVKNINWKQHPISKPSMVTFPAYPRPLESDEIDLQDTVTELQIN